MIPDLNLQLVNSAKKLTLKEEEKCGDMSVTL